MHQLAHSQAFKLVPARRRSTGRKKGLRFFASFN